MSDEALATTRQALAASAAEGVAGGLAVNDDVGHVVYWRGKPATELSREELIEALTESVLETQGAYEMMRRNREIEEGFRRETQRRGLRW